MTVLHTLKKPTPDFTAQFKSALDRLAADLSLDSIGDYIWIAYAIKKGF